MGTTIFVHQSTCQKACQSSLTIPRTFSLSANTIHPWCLVDLLTISVTFASEMDKAFAKPSSCMSSMEDVKSGDKVPQTVPSTVQQYC